MKAQQVRLRNQNSRVSTRGSSRGRTVSSPRTSHRRGDGDSTREPGSRVLWLMLLVGALLTAGFVLGLRSQINAHQIGEAEQKLRTQLDRFSNEQRSLEIEQKRVTSPIASEQVVQNADLTSIKFDQKYQPSRLSAAPKPSAIESIESDNALPPWPVAPKAAPARSVPVRQAVVNIPAEKKVQNRTAGVHKVNSRSMPVSVKGLKAHPAPAKAKPGKVAVAPKALSAAGQKAAAKSKAAVKAISLKPRQTVKSAPRR